MTSKSLLSEIPMNDDNRCVVLGSPGKDPSTPRTQQRVTTRPGSAPVGAAAFPNSPGKVRRTTQRRRLLTGPVQSENVIQSSKTIPKKQETTAGSLKLQPPPSVFGGSVRTAPHRTKAQRREGDVSVADAECQRLTSAWGQQNNSLGRQDTITPPSGLPQPLPRGSSAVGGSVGMASVERSLADWDLNRTDSPQSPGMTGHSFLNTGFGSRSVSGLHGGSFGGRSPPIRGPSAASTFHCPLGATGMHHYRASQATELSNQTQETTFSQAMNRRITAEFEDLELLGTGQFGDVFLCRDRFTSERSAIKRSSILIPRSIDERRAFQERNVLLAIRNTCPHLINLQNAWLDPPPMPTSNSQPFNCRTQQYLQMQYCPYGSVAELLALRRFRKERWEEPEVLTFLQQMATALLTMHSMNIAHVDVKPENIFLDSHLRYVLGDFGCAIFLDEKGKPFPIGPLPPPMTSGVSSAHHPGDLNNLATVHSQAQSVRKSQDEGPRRSSLFGAIPESGANSRSLDLASVDEGDCRYVSLDMLNQKQHYCQGDIFSLGISVFEMMSSEELPRGGPAFQALRIPQPSPSSSTSMHSLAQIPIHVRHLPPPFAALVTRHGYSVALAELVAAMMHLDPLQRPTASSVLQAPIFFPAQSFWEELSQAHSAPSSSVVAPSSLAVSALFGSTSNFEHRNSGFSGGLPDVGGVSPDSFASPPTVERTGHGALGGSGMKTPVDRWSASPENSLDPDAPSEVPKAATSPAQYPKLSTVFPSTTVSGNFSGTPVDAITMSNAGPLIPRGNSPARHFKQGTIAALSEMRDPSFIRSQYIAACFAAGHILARSAIQWAGSSA